MICHPFVGRLALGLALVGGVTVVSARSAHAQTRIICGSPVTMFSGTTNLNSRTVNLATGCANYGEVPAGQEEVTIRVSIPGEDSLAITATPDDSVISAGNAVLTESGVYNISLRVLTSHGVTGRVRLANASSSTGRVYEIPLFLARRPVVHLEAPSRSCNGVPCDLVASEQNLVIVTGENLGEIDAKKPVDLRIGEKSITVLLEQRNGQLIIPVTPATTTNTLQISASFPLRRGYESRPGEGISLVHTVQSKAFAVGLPTSEVRPSDANGNPLTTFYVGTPQRVSLAFPSLTGLSNNQTYSIYDAPDSSGVTRIATVTLSRETPSGSGTWEASLQPLHATAHRGVSGELPLLYMRAGTRIQPIGFRVETRPHIDRVTVEFPEGTSNDLALRAGDEVDVVLDGASAEAFTVEGTSPGVGVTLLGPVQRGHRVMRVTTPRTMPQHYELRLAHPAGFDTLLRFVARQPQKTVPLDFVAISYLSSDRRSRLPERGTRNRRRRNIGLTGTVAQEVNAKALEGVELLFAADELDRGRLNGVQYLNVEISMYDQERDAPVRTETRRIAVVPESTPITYQIDPAYTPVVGRTLDVDDILSRLTIRAKPRSQLRIRVSHDQQKHPRASGAREVRITQGGNILIEPSVTLPTGLLVYRGRTFRAATQYGGAFVNFRFFHPSLTRPTPLSAQLGIAAVQPDFLPDTTQNQKTTLSPMALLNYTFATVRERLSLTFSGGAVYLISTGGVYPLFSPGINVKL